jgi:pentatricopeptide repeat protein
LSCIVHLCNKLPESKTLKIYKIEALAKTGDTEEATKVLNEFSGASYNPDLCYLKGII